MKPLRLSSAALLIGWFSLQAVAQTTGELVGRVVDASGVGIPGALVEVRSPVLIRPRQAGTDYAGRYQLPLLPPGPYEVMARMTGFDDALEKDVRVPLGETVTLPLTLTVSAKAEVTVTGEPPLVDVTSAKAGLSVTERVLNNLPLGRNFESVAYTVPGVGSDVLGPTFYGAASLENTYVVDGLNTTGVVLGGQGKKVPLEFVQEVEVRSGGYEAEYGKALGGNINVITKTGGNDFHGNLFGYYDSEALGAADQHEVDRAAMSIEALEVPRKYDVGLSLGGPLVRERLWFFGAYDRAQVDQDYQAVDHFVYTPDGLSGSVSEERAERTRTDLFAANFSWAPIPSHSLALSVFGDPGTFRGRTGTGYIGPPSATVYEKETGGTDVTARWTGFLRSLVAEAQYGYHEERSRELSDSSSLPSIQEWRDWGIQFVEGSGPTGWDYFLVDATYRRNVTRVSGTVTLANHELKVGAGYELENPERTNRYSGGEYIWNSRNPDGSLIVAQHTYLARNPLNCTHLSDGREGSFGFVPIWDCRAWEKATEVRADFRTKLASAYLQDSWRPVPNLTVNLGLRYDYQEFVHTDGSVVLKLADQWSPRLSVAWDPGGNGRTRVFASYGRYYQTVPQEFQAWMMSNLFRAYAFNDSAGPDPVDVYVGFAPIYLGDFVPDDLEGIYQDEVAAGAEMQLGASWSVGVRGTYRALGSMLEDRCDRWEGQGIDDLFPADSYNKCALVNPGRGEWGQFRDPANPDCFADFPENQQPAPCETVKARRYYRGVEVAVHNQPTKDLFLQASYVYSSLTGNFEGPISYFSAGLYQVAPNINHDFDGPSILTNSFGRLTNDRTHQAKLSGYYSFPFGLTAGVVAWFASGKPISLAGAGGYSTYIVPRGTWDELPSTYEVDLHLQYSVAFGPVTVSPVLDVFNLTDVQRATARMMVYDNLQTTGDTKPPYDNPTDPRFGLDMEWQKPRLLRLGLKVAF